MGNSLYLGGNVKSAYCSGDVKELWKGPDKVFSNNVVRILGEDYKVVKAGNQIWLAENFRYNEQGLDIVSTNEYGIYYCVESLTRIKELLSGSGWHVANEQDFYDLGCHINGGEPSDEDDRYDNTSEYPYFNFRSSIDCNDLWSVRDGGNDKYELGFRKSGAYEGGAEYPIGIGSYCQIYCENADTQYSEIGYTSRIYMSDDNGYRLQCHDDYYNYTIIRLVKD